MPSGTVQCDRYDYSYPLELCISMPRLAPLKVCEGKNTIKGFPKHKLEQEYTDG